MKDNYVCDTFRIQRCDYKVYVFESLNILSDSSKSYYNYLKLDNYEKTVNRISSCSKRSRTEARKNSFYQFGSTMGSAKYPKFRREIDSCGDKKIYSESMLPRPVVCCRPSNLGWSMQKEPWLIDLVRDLEQYTISYIERHSHCIPHANEFIKQLMQFKHGVDRNLLICNSIFNQMIMIGEMKQNSNINLHVDKDDAISCILHLGKVTSGGSTNYYNGLKAGKNVPTCLNGQLVHSVPFEHGRIQIGFYKDIVHGVDHWEGPRITLDFNTKIGVLNHFCIYGNRYTNQYKQAGYPPGNFVAI